MSFAEDDFGSWRRRRARPGAVLADGSTSVLADLRGTAVDPDLDPIAEFEKFGPQERKVGRVGQAIESGLDWLGAEIEPAADYLRANADFMGREFAQNPNVPKFVAQAGGFMQGVNEALAPMATPSNIALTALPALRGAKAAASLPRSIQAFMAGTEGALGGIETGRAAAAYQDLPDDATFGQKALVGGMTAMGALGSLEALGAAARLAPEPTIAARPFSGRTQGPRNRGRLLTGEVQPPMGPEVGPPPPARETLLLPERASQGPIPLAPPARAIDRPDLLRDADLLDELDRAMQGGNVDQFRTFLDELEARGARGALSPEVPPRRPPGEPPTAPPPAAGIGGAPASPGPRTSRRGRPVEPLAPPAPVSEADEIAAALEALKARAGQISTRFEPQPIVPIEQRMAARAPGPEFMPVEPPPVAAAQDALGEVEELLGISPQGALDRSYENVLGKYRAGEQLGSSRRTLEDMAGVRDAREAARSAVDVEGPNAETGVIDQGVQPGSSAAEYPQMPGRGVDVSGGVPDRALGGEAGQVPARVSKAVAADLERIKAEARAAGIDIGPDDERLIREAIENSRAYIDDMRGIDPDRAMLEFIAERGGLNAKAERAGGGMGTELDDLQRNLGGADAKLGQFHKRTGEALQSSLDADVRVPGIEGAIVTRRTIKEGPNVRPVGLNLDEMVTQLQAAGFKVDMETLPDVIQAAAARLGDRGVESLDDVMGGLYGYRPGTAWWKRDAVDDVLDILGTGEGQARLPGAGAVRAQEIATSEVAEAPFALGRQADTTPDALERDLFAAPAAQADVPRGTSRLDDAPSAALAPENPQAFFDAVDEAAAAVDDVPTFDALPANVRAYLTKRLGWTPEEINALDVDTAIAHGRDQIRPPRPEPSPETRAATEGRVAVRQARAADAEDELLSELERFFEVEQPARAARAQARAVEARTPVPKRLETGKIVPKSEVNKAMDRQIEVAQEMGRDRESAARMAAMSDSEKKAHSSRVAGEHRQIDREIERAWKDPNPSPGRIEKIAALYEEQAEAFLKGQLKGGTGKELSNDELAKKFTTLYGGIPIADPALWKGFVDAVKTQPAMRALVGAMAGYNVDDEDGFRGALYGMALAAGAPAGAKALARSFRQAKAGRNPWPIFDGPSADKDISFLRAYLPFSPERTVPEVFNKVNEQMTNLQAMWESSYKGDFGHLEKISKKRMAGEIRAAAKAAEVAKQPRKAWYLEKLANQMENRLTKGQEIVEEIGKSAGVKLAGNEFEKHVTGNIYRMLIGWALDSAAKNLTQPILASLYVSPKSLTTAYKLSRSPEAKKMAERFDLNIKNIAELADTAIVNRAVPAVKKGIEWVEDKASAPIRMTDNYNRRVVLMAALEQEGKLQAALAGKLALNDPAVMKAMSIVRKTQGHTGPMGSHPLYRGPIMGSIKPFTKFPFLFIDNVLSAFQDPEARGAKFVATLLGAALVGRMFGIDTEDLLLSGGRPLNLDPSHPQSTARDIASGKSFPATRAAVDVKSHFTGDADHDFTEDLGQLVVSRYPVKVVKAAKHLLSQGMGEHRTAAGTGVEHDGVDDLLGLMGLRTTERGDKMRAREEQYEYLDRARRKSSASKRELREDWRSAFEDGDEDALAEVEALMTPQQRRQLRREAGQTPDQRMRSRVPKDVRPDFDRRFGGQ